MKQLYAVNTTNTNLQLKRGAVHIARDSYRKVTEEDLAHPDFTHAKDMGWLEISEEKPDDKPARGGIKPIENVSASKGMTFKELKESEAKEPPKPEPVITAIGKPEEKAPVVEPEVKTEKDPEPTVKAAGRKAAAEKAAE
jgi:hypothetical protein